MQFFDVTSFVSRLQEMGLKLTATRLADGSIRINKWKMPEAAERADEIDSLWTSAVGEDQARIDTLAKHLVLSSVRKQTSSAH
jgi:hypothetical protein